MKIRCIWHVVLGAVLPWLAPEANIGGWIGYVGYQYLQYKYLTNRIDRTKDDSFKDINEMLIPYIISAIVKRIVWG